MKILCPARSANGGWKAHAEGRLEDRLSQLAKPKLLIIDELGYLPFEPNAAHLFFQLVSPRYERGSVMIMSNRPVGEWGTVFGDPKKSLRAAEQDRPEVTAGRKALQ